MSYCVQVFQRVASQVLQLELESTEAANTVDGRRFKGHHDGSGYAEEFWRHSRHDVAGGVSLSLAIVNRLERREDQPIIWRAASRKREAGDGKCAENVGIGSQDFLGLPGDAGCVRKRSPRRRLHYYDEVVLIFL